MPKRDESYMESQRTQIAEAARECLLENGVPDTSLRDICARAGVSMGAFYIHFSNKAEVILAACAMDYVDGWRPPATARNWDEYITQITDEYRGLRSIDGLRRQRLSLQFMAEQLLVSPRVAGLDLLFKALDIWFQDNLRALKAAGEVALPLGLEQTARIHASLLVGANYLENGAPDADGSRWFDAVIESLGVTAGRVEPLKGLGDPASSSANPDDRASAGRN